MSKMRSLLVFLAIVAMAIGLAACGNAIAADKATMTTGLDKKEIRNEAFKDLFPLQYASYQKNSKMEDTKYAGSIKRSKFDHDKEPYLPILFNGYGFSIEYNEDRGHTYANEDIKNIARINDKSIGSCLTCKSTAVPQMIEEMGDKYWGGNFRKEIFPKAEAMGHSPIGCSDCHDPQTMDLRVTRPNAVKAFQSRGIDITKASKNDMRSYVCAQCHVEYYFAASNSEVTFPWSKGVKPEQMYDYYTTVAKPAGFNQDWVHSISGAPILKAQHPDYEAFSEGPHGKAGVACADCHMPYERVDGKKKMSSHWWTSPFKTMQTSCATCHSDQNMDKLKERVISIQDTHMDALHSAEEISVKSHYYVNKMLTSGANPDRIKEAQEQIRKGQWYWDIIAAENSTGFHNPQGSMATLKMSADASNIAIQIAVEELTKKGVDLKELDKQIASTMKAVYDEPDSFKKKDKAINDYFPAQLPK